MPINLFMKRRHISSPELSSRPLRSVEQCTKATARNARQCLCRNIFGELSENPLHHLRISVLNSAHISAETVLIKLFVSCAVPEAAGVGRDLVR